MTVAETKEEILDRLRRHEDQLRLLGVRRLGLFGSFVRGEETAESDVDLLLEFVPDEKTFDHFMSIAHLLEDVLQRPVELVTTESLGARLAPRILAETEDVLAGR